MLLFQVIVFTLVDFSSSYSNPRECYGGMYTFKHPGPTINIYYMSRTSDEKILVVKKGTSVHERFEVSASVIKMKDLTEQDDGAKLFFNNRNYIQLTIIDCQPPDTKVYGSIFAWRIPSSATYMEFTRVMSLDSHDKPFVIWNRANPTPSRATVNDNVLELYDLKQSDSGYYKCRGANNELLQWKRLTVEAYHRPFEKNEGEFLDMDLPYEFQLSHIEFVPEGSSMPRSKSFRRSKMEVNKSYFTLRDLKYEDSGTYRFIDNDGNMAVHVELNVRKVEIPTWGYVVIVVVIVFGILICCCCMKKCCCKKSSSKGNCPGSNEVAAPVYYHDSNQSAPSTVTLLSKEPRRFTADATIHDAAARSIGPPTNNQQAIVTGDMGPTPFLATSSDVEPQFEMKGSLFLSAPPLSSETSIQDVYTSDKLNFL